MANVPSNDPNVDASAIVPAPVNPDHVSTQPVGLGNGFAPHWIGDNIPNNQNGCDNIKMDRMVRNVMSDLSGLMKLVKGLSDQFDEYEGSKVFEDKRALEKELVNERNGKEFYREFDEYMCRMLQNRQKSEGSFPLPLDAAIAAAAVATSGIDDDDDDTDPIDSQPYEPHGSPRDT
nr:hypothetical protein [Tanacetum cinerariifolium]